MSKLSREELNRLGAICEELRLSLNKRDSEIAKTAARIWGMLNDELVRIDARLNADPFEELHDAMDGWA